MPPAAAFRFSPLATPLTTEMGESAHLRACDYRTVYRLIGECRDLGADPTAWRLHLLISLCAELGGRVGAGGEATGLSRGQFIPLSTVDVGWENDDQRQAMFDWMELQARSGAPSGLLPMKLPAVDSVLMSRDDVFTDREWYQTVQFVEYLRRSELDHLVISMRRISANADHYCGLTIMRGLGDRKFSPRDKQFLAILHQELAPMVGRQLAAAHQPSALMLSPRLREVLDCLLEGDSEKQVAAGLRLTPRTVST